ncbi:putative cytochrome oxidase maturation protein, cbb3-type [Leptospira kirschneri str. 200801774]|uniref:Cytochrome oxidase maturation protein, cbb3-type n=1 Tax=Leptospira kirschneri str. 200802841 TaxID=1193047 RepID=A0A828XVK7_9LEPT|nr:putative cytochrome oxidase maturation protein, cbb3-type [Leptospira kirschneri str. 200802841]EMO81627.1 putative cytochrome oxidase maturation protein, cbb3-type [Leptospira kirschneri str. 200801774]
MGICDLKHNQRFAIELTVLNFIEISKTMNALYLTIPLAILIALVALSTFLWSLKSGRY